MRSVDESAVRALQPHLAHADPSLVELVLSGPFSGLVSTTDAGRVVGYAIWLPGPTATLVELVVATDFRRQGRGRRLVRAVVETLETAEELVLTTPVDGGSADAVAFYTDLGFEVEKKLHGFYSNGADALRLRRLL